MPNNVANTTKSDPVRLPETFGRQPLKAGPEPDVFGLGSQIFEALVDFCGSVKALAFELENADPSLIRRELRDLNFARVRRAKNQQLRGVVARVVAQEWGALANEEDHADALIANIRRLIDQLAQYVAFKRTA